ncbi:hypothetical protein A3860_21050 [Niastella vici]|uniref:Uncharacterized protein n=1 Tax=Niastella vici TaxID=1703345 RepID=A0A1V9G1S1_9BACT|nr:DUF1573 domain-containing protein [Niastella vici]OQP64458.1 hypothetical protein A3860_21050 [Niastella vici]
MTPCNSLKKFFPYLILLACLIACGHENDRLANYVDPADNFSIPNGAMVKNEQGKKIKLADVLVSDSIFVIRVTNNQPEESKHLVFYRLAYFVDDYPHTDSIIILTDQLPADSCSENSWCQQLKFASTKVRVYTIEDSLLSAALESKQRAYVFFLDKKLQAQNIYMPEPASEFTNKTIKYFSIVANMVGRKSIFPGRPFYRSADTARDTDNPNAGTIFFSGRKAKVGDCTVKDTYYKDFYFRNKANEPLEINSITNNWGSRANCYVYVPEKPVKPGAECRIRVYYRPRSKGWFRNEINLYTNTDRYPLTFTISGTAVEASGNKGISWLESLGESKDIGFKKYRRF